MCLLPTYVFAMFFPPALCCQKTILSTDMHCLKIKKNRIFLVKMHAIYFLLATGKVYLKCEFKLHLFFEWTLWPNISPLIPDPQTFLLYTTFPLRQEEDAYHGEHWPKAQLLFVESFIWKPAPVVKVAAAIWRMQPTRQHGDTSETESRWWLRLQCSSTPQWGLNSQHQFLQCIWCFEFVG